MQTFDESTRVHQFLRVIESTDPDLALHGDRTAELACMVAERIGLGRHDIERLHLAARLHDIGKLFISREILDKPTAPTEEQWIELKRHPQIGFDLVTDHVALRIAEVVLTHHERFDGTGYPNGVPGAQIPIETRILQVADAFDAITSVRPYQPALPEEYAISELRRYSGTQFDPDAVNALLTVVARRKATLERTQSFVAGDVAV